MRTYKALSLIPLLAVSLLLFTHCETEDYQDLVNNDPAQTDWISQIEEIIFESGIIVTKGQSIQAALDAAQAGDVIYIESGTYNEKVIINKADIKLIGLEGADGEKVSILSPDLSQSALSVTQNAPGLEIMNIHGENLAHHGSYRSLKRLKRNHRFLSISRTELMAGIAHYQFEIQLGMSEYDVIRLHRVVREHRPYRPMRTDGSIFMIHGSIQDFDDIFFRPGVENPTTNNSSPVYLAANYIDVWGIDLAWTLVPVETTDFNFMKDWGVERDARHTLTAMSIARIIRGMTGQGLGRMNLLGFSYGVPVAFTAAGAETQQPPVKRDIKGLVNAEGAMKYAPEDEESRLAACITAAAQRDLINSGVYNDSNGLFFALVGDLAVLAPDEPSEIVPGLTNYQTSLFFGSSTYLLGNPLAPFWHFVGGEFDENGLPAGLLYTEPDRWNQLLRGLDSYQPLLGGLELRECLCNEIDVSIDDHLGEIKVPILYLGVQGGFGPQGVYTSSLTKSKDITNHIVKLQADELRAIDYGHADMWMSENADRLVWEALRKWLVSHAGRYRDS